LKAKKEQLAISEMEEKAYALSRRSYIIFDSAPSSESAAAPLAARKKKKRPLFRSGKTAGCTASRTAGCAAVLRVKGTAKISSARFDFRTQVIFPARGSRGERQVIHLGLPRSTAVRPT
jgi:hypothetical protein